MHGDVGRREVVACVRSVQREQVHTHRRAQQRHEVGEADQFLLHWRVDFGEAPHLISREAIQESSRPIGHQAQDQS